ncbi:hypothetical protein ABMA10_00360 [Plantibacter sp. RU18]
MLEATSRMADDSPPNSGHASVGSSADADAAGTHGPVWAQCADSPARVISPLCLALASARAGSSHVEPIGRASASNAGQRRKADCSLFPNGTQRSRWCHLWFMIARGSTQALHHFRRNNASTILWPTRTLRDTRERDAGRFTGGALLGDRLRSHRGVAVVSVALGIRHRNRPMTPMGKSTTRHATLPPHRPRASVGGSSNSSCGLKRADCRMTRQPSMTETAPAAHRLCEDRRRHRGVQHPPRPSP